MTPAESLVFRTMSGVLMPWPCLPNPSPTLQPNFCIILRAICSFYSLCSGDSYGCCCCSGTNSMCCSRWASSFSRKSSLLTSQLLGCWGSQSGSGLLVFSSRSSFYFQASAGMRVPMLIFFADSMLFNLELMLARFTFFFVSGAFTSFLAQCGSLASASAGASELIKLFSFCSRAFWSFWSSNLGRGGGLLGRSISISGI